MNALTTNDVREIARELSTDNLAVARLADIAVTLKQYEKIIDELISASNARQRQLLEADGEIVTDKGTRRLQVGSVLLEMRPHRTGTDSKKLEALLRLRGIDLERAMDMTISYKVNTGKLAKLGLSAEDMAAIEYDVTMVVQSPKPAFTAERSNSDE